MREADICEYAQRMCVRDMRTCGTWFLQKEHLKGELQRADMQQIGQSRRVWLQEVRRQGQQLRGGGGGRLIGRSGSAWSWACGAAALHSKMTIACSLLSQQPYAIERALYMLLCAGG